MRRSLLRIATFSTAIVLAASACRSSSPPDGPTATPAPTAQPGTGPFVEGTAKLEGAIEGAGDIEILYPLADEARSSCAAIAQGDRRTRSYAIPLPSRVGERDLLWRAAIRDYGGPGNFDAADLKVFSVEVLSGDEDLRTYEKDDNTTASITVNDDNSGSITFSDLREPEGGRVSGAARWTCS